MRASSNRVEGLSFCDVKHLHGLSKAIWYHTQQVYFIKLFIMAITIHGYYNSLLLSISQTFNPHMFQGPR